MNAKQKYLKYLIKKKLICYFKNERYIKSRTWKLQ
jgi:hypothetical protein